MFCFDIFVPCMSAKITRIFSLTRNVKKEKHLVHFGILAPLTTSGLGLRVRPSVLSSSTRSLVDKSSWHMTSSPPAPEREKAEQTRATLARTSRTRTFNSCEPRRGANPTLPVSSSLDARAGVSPVGAAPAPRALGSGPLLLLPLPAPMSEVGTCRAVPRQRRRATTRAQGNPRPGKSRPPTKKSKSTRIPLTFGSGL
jgi:hypothetical protein